MELSPEKSNLIKLGSPQENAISMVVVAIAGGTGPVAREVIDVLVATAEHDLIVLTRMAVDPQLPDGVTFRVVDYSDVDNLVGSLKGVHTVLSFVQVSTDTENRSQKNLIDACIIAGVKRFAPSEHGSAGVAHMPWYNGKAGVREYLIKVNSERKKIEYCLFQPGLLLDHLGYGSSRETTRHIERLHTLFDFEKCRTIIVDGHENARMTVTTVHDYATMLAIAVGYAGEWPTSGGMGNTLSVSDIIDIGQAVRDRAFSVTRVRLQDLEEGRLETTWALSSTHSSIPADQVESMQRKVSVGMLLSTVAGAWVSSGELNALFPDYTFTSAEKFLHEVWQQDLEV